MAAGRDLPIMHFESPEAWQSWLDQQHSSSDGVWLKIAKKGSQASGVSYQEALEVAICYGWIDGQKGKLDEEFWLQRFTPRKPGGKWSKVNTEKAAELIASGRMKPTGQREVDQAKADGRWDAAYHPQSRAAVPEDLQRKLEENTAALDFFKNLDRHNRYVILYRVQNAAPRNRAKRIDEFVEMLAAGRKMRP